MLGESNLFWGKSCHFGRASVHYIKSTNKSWHGSEPPLFWQCQDLESACYCQSSFKGSCQRIKVDGDVIGAMIINIEYQYHQYNHHNCENQNIIDKNRFTGALTRTHAHFLIVLLWVEIVIWDLRLVFEIWDYELRLWFEIWDCDLFLRQNQHSW